MNKILVILIISIFTILNANGQETSTASPSNLPIVNFTIPKNSTTDTCLLARFSLEINIDYKLKDNTNKTLTFRLSQPDDYDGACNDAFNSLIIPAVDNWTLTFNYTYVSPTDKTKYQLSFVKLDYTVDSNNFPDADKSELGPRTVYLSNLTLFSTNQASSYKCFAKTSVTLDNKVKLDFSNYQGEPFISKDKKDKTVFDTAYECDADNTSTSKLVPIIVGSALAVLVVLVLIAYIIGRRRHRPGYSQV